MQIIKNLLVAVVIIGIVGAMGYQLYANKQVIDEKAKPKAQVDTSVPVRTAQVEERTLNKTLSLTGAFEARKELSIIAETQGRLTQLNIQEGAQVHKGQNIAKIDDTNVRAQLATANAALAKAQKDVERFERLLDAGAISQLQLEDIRLNAQNQQSNVTNIEQMLKYTTPKSPMTGVIKEVMVEEGSFAAPGAPIATVVDISRLKMVVKVAETDIIKVKKGQIVSIQTDVYPNKTFNGKVTLIAVQADEGRKYDVEIELVNNKEFPLKAGMYGDVMITPSGKAETGLFISRNAVVGSVKNAQVYILDQAGIAKLRAVEVGAEEGDQVRILKGLQKGETVITTGQINLSDGKKVEVI